MRIHFARHFTTPRHYIAVAALENRREDGDGSDDWAAYIDALPLDRVGLVPPFGPLGEAPRGLAAVVVEWGAKLTEEDARHFFPTSEFPQLAGLTYRR